MTNELAATGAQVIPVLALGAVISYRARVRAHEQLLQPFAAGMREFSSRVVTLHEQGLRGQALIDAIKEQRYGDRRGVGSTYLLRVSAVIAILATIAANLVSELICLAVLGDAVTGRPWQATFVLCSITAGLILLVVVPVVAGAPTWSLPLRALRSPEYARARTIIEEAGVQGAGMTDVDTGRTTR